MGGIGQAQVNEIAFALFTWGASKSCADSKAMRTEPLDEAGHEAGDKIYFYI